MNNKDISNALQQLTPGAEWVLRGDTLDGLEWLDKTQVQPTADEISASIAAAVPVLTLEQRIAQLEAKVGKTN